MSRLQLTLAISEYDHVRDLANGTIVPNGIDIIPLLYDVEEIFYRFTLYREWDLSEMSMGKYTSLIASGDDTLIAIPVFPSRMFRQSSCFVRAGGPVQSPEDLRGKRIGIPEWTQTAGIYSRAWIAHDIGIDLADIHWIRGGVNQPGREEKVSVDLPAGVELKIEAERSLNDMLISGDIDALLTAHPPAAFEQNDPAVKQLVENYPEVEEAYYRATGIFPIMHVIAIKRDVFDAHPWIAMNLFDTFEEAKRRSYERVLSLTASRIPIPWGFEFARRAQKLFGDDWMPYGLEANRTTLEAFLRFSFEQGTTCRHLAPEELFPEELTGRFKV